MRVALIQQSYHGSSELTIKKTLELIKDAKQNKAELVVLQELHQDRYFCINEDVKNFKLANTIESDIEFWSNIAKSFEVVLVTTLFEKRAVGLYHNTSYIFEKDGSLVGKYRKMHIPDDPGFYEKFYFTPGDLGFKPIQTSVGKLGVLICWDQWFPEAARLMALGGADMLIYPTAIGWFDSDDMKKKQRELESWVAVQRGHAIANALPVITVNRVGYEKDNFSQIDGIRFWGNSFVFDGGGEELLRVDEKSEEAFIVDIDMQKSQALREIWPFLRDRRVDNYHDLSKIYID
ncbi:MAG TPA: carbon-nitrogen hydrolase [Campylobacterales bacterium]|nr:carbon-nitrogen hydrolase [Campylobacterales bacterium]